MLGSLCILAFLPGTSAGQNEITPDNLFEMSMEELMNVPIVTSGSRQAQKIYNSSVPISVITAEDIHYSGLTSLPEILQFAPGVDVFPLYRYMYAVGVRGFHDMVADRTLTLINGRPADSPFFGGSEFYRYPLLMEDIERIEIIRGPGSAAWGANAFTGGINIITKKPEALKGWLASTTVTQFGDAFTHLRGAGLYKDWYWKLSVGYNDVKSSDQAGAGKYVYEVPELAPLMGITNYRARDFSRDSIFSTEFSHQISDTSKLSLGLDYSHNEKGGFEALFAYPEANCWFETGRSFVKLEQEFDNDDTLELTWAGNFSSTKIPSISKWATAEHTLAAQYNFDWGTAHRLSVGGDVRLVNLSFDTLEPREVYLDHNHYDEYFAGLFLIDQWTINSSWRIESQIRADTYSETTQEISARLSSLYTIDEADEKTLRLSIARAFRTPSLALRGTQVQRLPLGGDLYLYNLLKPNALENEKILSFEAGYHQKLSEDLRFQTDVYYQMLDNLIGFSPMPDPLLLDRLFYSARNISGAKAFGTEVELKKNLENGSLSLWYCFNDVQEEQSHQEMRSYGPSKHKTGLTWRLFLSKDYTFNLNYKNSSFVPNYSSEPTIGSNDRLDITLSRKIVKGKGEWMIGVTDLLNETQGPNLGVTQFSGYEVPGRTLFTRLQVNF